MRRFSQRSHLVTLSEINITPLLDLAFVLLIIFVITTPLLKPEQSIDLKLPTGGTPDKAVDRRNLRIVEVSPQGVYLLDRVRMRSLASSSCCRSPPMATQPLRCTARSSVGRSRSVAMAAVSGSRNRSRIWLFRAATEGT